MKRPLLIVLPALLLLVQCTQEEKETRQPEKVDKVSSKETVLPIVLSSEHASISVSPREGGKISSLTLEGKEFLSLKDVHADNWGSTFWASPQKIWGWPPPKAFDVLPYEVLQQEEDQVTIQGQLDTLTGLSFRKTISLANEVVTIDYYIKNNTDSVINVAPWEITRVPPNGLSYFPKGEHEQAPFTTVDTSGCIWFDYKNATIQEDHDKLRADGMEGWLAHVNDNMLLVKFFPDITPMEVDVEEAEVEIYANPDKSYIELEPQGPLQGLEPDEELKWTVNWVIVEVPKEVQIEAGNVDLVELARAQKEKIPNNE